MMQSMATSDVDNFRMNLRPLCAGKQAKIAEQAGISPVYLSRILNGHNSPTIDVACDLARAVGQPIGSLLSKPRKRNGAA